MNYKMNDLVTSDTGCEEVEVVTLWHIVGNLAKQGDTTFFAKVVSSAHTKWLGTKYSRK